MRCELTSLLLGLITGCAAAAPSAGSDSGRVPAGADAGVQPVATAATNVANPDAAASHIFDGGSSAASDGGSVSGTHGGSAPASEEHHGPLATFHDALRDLACGGRTDHVRIAWLGDSHAQADFWTGTVRTALQQRFGNAGPGFVRLGYRGYRHDGVKLAMHGRWYNRPKRPATTERWKDGNLGLGGILSTGYADKPWASLTLTDPAHAQTAMRWELCYRMNEPVDQFRLQLSGSKRRTIKATGTLGSLRHLALEAKGQATLKVAPREGRPFFCGVIIETNPADRPGVVLDNLGIDGARYATALAWNPVFWGAELARRDPALVVIEYGGNEASDFQSRPDAYKRHLLRLIERVRKVRADVSCLVVGLTDRADTETRVEPIRDAAREGAGEAGCMFWDSYEVMGGKGSMKRWRDEKKAAEDGIHMLPRGYVELGTKLVEDLMAAYRPSCRTGPPVSSPSPQ